MSTTESIPDFSLVRDDYPFRLMQRVGLVPREGLGIARRALFLSLLAWLPLATWAALNHRALADTGFPEPLFAHYGIHVRCLIAIPLLIVAQAVAARIGARIIPWFVVSGIVPAHERERFSIAIERTRRTRDSAWPWIILLALAVGWTAIGPLLQDYHEMTWSAEGAGERVRAGFGGLWFLWVARFIYTTLLLAWAWRLLLLTTLFIRISRLELDLVPTHGDRMGGLAFVERFAWIWSPVVLALSSVLCAHWAHLVIYHGETLHSLRAHAAMFVAGMLVLFLAPFLAFSGQLLRSKLDARLEYGRLVGAHGRRVRRRWILREPVDDPAILDAPEIGPVADTVALYEAADRMRIVPVGWNSLFAVLAPTLAPMAIVVMLKIPVLDFLQALVHALA